jgi:arylformamidase
MMEIVDLTHLMENNMPAYPGEPSPVFEKKMTHDKDGVQVIRFSMLTHSGTHLDTPAHFFASGKTIDQLSVSAFAGKGVLLNCSSFGQKTEIIASHLKQFEDDLAKAEFALVFTGWDKYWGTETYYQDFPVLSGEAATYLSGFNLKGIALDVPSIDPVASPDYPNHHLLLGKGLLIIENLANLHLLLQCDFTFASFPLKIKNGDGSPVRAVAMITR